MAKEILDKDMYDSVKSGHKKVGKVALMKHLEGVRLTQREAIQAKCYDCDGMGETGECDIVACALYPYSPYGGLKAPSRMVTLPPDTASTTPPSEKDMKDES